LNFSPTLTIGVDHTNSYNSSLETTSASVDAPCIKTKIVAGEQRKVLLLNLHNGNLSKNLGVLVLALVVVLTNSADPTDIKSASEAGANSYVLKPADRKEIWRVVELIQNYWLAHNATPLLVLCATNL
jgi:hypothetical protein